MNKDASIELMHVGETKPQIIEDGTVVPVALQTGDPATTILASAEQVDLIAMPTKGHQGILDALRGSSTEFVVGHSPCRVLAVPAKFD
jgi:nucleotide-binding universal stress UspA family protein